MAKVFGCGLSTVNVSVVVPLTGMVAAPKALEIVGGARTVMLAGTVAWSTTALMVSTPAAVAVNVSVACPLAWMLVCTLDSVPSVGVPGKIEAGAGRPISTLRFATGTGVP